MKISLLILVLTVSFAAQAAPTEAKCPSNTRQILTCNELSEDQASSSIAVCVPENAADPTRDSEGEVVFVDSTNDPAEVLQTKALINKNNNGIDVNFKSEKDGIEFLLVSPGDGEAVLLFETQHGLGELYFQCK